jgi:hypothetical protein
MQRKLGINTFISSIGDPMSIGFPAVFLSQKKMLAVFDDLQ